MFEILPSYLEFLKVKCFFGFHDILEMESDSGFSEDFAYCVHCETLWRWTMFSYDGYRSFIGYVRIVGGQMKHSDFLKYREFLKSIGKK